MCRVARSVAAARRNVMLIFAMAHLVVGFVGAGDVMVAERRGGGVFARGRVFVLLILEDTYR